MEIITSHVNADFDAIAAMVAAQKIYPKAKLVFTGSQNKNVREFLSLHRDILYFADLKYLDKKSINRIIVVDTRIAERLGELEDVVYQKNVEIFTFDHHPPSEDDMDVSRDFSEHTGATTTTLVKIIRDRKIRISSFEATLFALGIHEDTGSLTYPTSTYQDAEALAFLMAVGANANVIDRFLNQPLTGEQRTLLDSLLKSVHIENIHGVKVMLTSAKVNTYIDGASVVTRKIADLENIDVIFSFISTQDRIYIIGRSRIDEVSIGEILLKFDGGGHAQAGSAVIKETSVRKVEQALIAELSAHIKAPLTAADIMSRTVVTVTPETSLKEAAKILVRNNYTGLPVIEDEELAGMISMQDIDKAARHGLSHAPVKGFMSRKVVTVSPSISWDEIETIFEESDVGRLPVVKDGKMIGIVSRSDLLRGLHGIEYLVEPKEDSGISKRISRVELVQRIKALLPADVQQLLREMGRLAEKNRYVVYLVGGVVRDLLLNHRNLDIDIVVEGNGIGFGKLMVDKLGGRIVAHKKFGTAVVVLPSHFHVDIATARTEFYEHPAALPKVEFSSIRRDLARRDFALNAMAVALNTPKFGSLLDFFGGQQDIQDKRIKVLHNLSFVEDPTRIFRAIRFEQRYGFQMDRKTEQLVKQAINMDLVGRLTNVRIRDELIGILSEDTAWDALQRLSELGALKNLHPEVVKIEPQLRTLFKSIQNAMPQLSYYFSRKTRRWLIFLIALLRNLKPDDLDTWCKQMRFKKADAQILREGVVEAPAVLKALASTSKLKNSELYYLLNSLSQESIEYIYAKCSQRLVKQRINFYLANLRGVRLSIGGKDLLRMGFKPSPLFSKARNELLTAKLDGLARSKSEEENFVRNLLEKEQGQKRC